MASQNGAAGATDLTLPTEFDGAKDLKTHVEMLEKATNKQVQPSPRHRPPHATLSAQNCPLAACQLTRGWAQISQLGGGASSGTSKVYVCSDYMKHKAAYVAKIRSLKASDSDPGAKQYLKDHPYKGQGAWPFRIAARQPRGKNAESKKWVLNTTATNLTHGSTCTSIFKAKKAHLMRDPEFRAAVHTASAGKDGISCKNLETIAESKGYGGVIAGAGVLYTVRKAALNEHAKVFSEKFEALPVWLDDYNKAHKDSKSHVCRAGAGSWDRHTTADGMPYYYNEAEAMSRWESQWFFFCSDLSV